MPKKSRMTFPEETLMRSRWIATEMENGSAHFGEKVPMRVCCMTWNVNGKKIDVDLSSWLSRGEPADLYAIGVQEMVDLTAVNVVADGKTAKKRADDWRRVLSVALSRVGDYELVAQRHMVGVFLCVFAASSAGGSRNVSAGSCAEACSSVAGCGVMGMLGNKGGVSIRLRVLDTTICFVCAHLAAHRDNVEGRNSDFSSILSKTEFKAAESATRSFLPSSLSLDDLYSETLKIEDHDLVFWLGDLNYRIHSALDVAEVFSRAEANDLEFLKANDQLNMERAAGRVFRGFHEAQLSFPVTYKYQTGTSSLERRPEKKLRAPAWCDRVLWRKMRNHVSVKVESYESNRDLNPSDHNPVRATFSVDLLQVDRDKKNVFYSNLVRRLDAASGKTDTPLDLDGFAGGERIVDLGSVRYGLESSRRFRVANNTTFVRHWRFAFDTTISWLRVKPTSGTLFPGESESISVSALVDSRQARRLTSRLESLNDVLCFRCDGTRDIFVKIKGDWIPSRWGMSLEELCARPEKSSSSSSYSRAQQPTPLPVPKELWHMIDAIDMGSPHLFFRPGIPEEMDEIRRALDQDRPLPTARVSPYSLADSLVSFLAALAAPVVPRHLLPECEIDDVRAWTRDVLLRSLNPASYNTFLYCLSFFRQLLKHSHSNMLTPAKLAAVITNCMLPQDDRDARRPIRGSLLAGCGAAYEVHRHRIDGDDDDDAYFCDMPSTTQAAPTPPRPEPVVNQRHYVAVALQYLLVTPAL